MKSRMARWSIALALGLLMASPGYAQIGQGRLAGTVTDAQGAVLPGVTVTVTSPALIGTRSAVTEADGRFLFPSLPSGAYKVVYELQGFRQNVRENIQVVLGQTISVDAQMQIGGLTENVVVTGASPVVDVATTKIGTNLKGEELIGVPNSTDAWGALSEAPGVRMQGFDVGGSHKSQQSAYEVFGVQWQARVVTDGVDHTEGVGGTGFYGDYFANEEVSISALGADVEMNSPGAAIVTTIKSGGNAFKGLEHLSYEPGELRRQQRRSVGHRGARLQLPAERQRPAAVRESQPPVLGRASRSRRPDQAGQGLVLRCLQPLQDRQGRRRRRRGGRDRPRHLRQLHRKGHRQAHSGPDAHWLHPARPETEAAARSVDLAPTRINPGAGQLVDDVQGRMAVGGEQPRLPQRQRRQLPAGVADGPGRRSHGEPAGGRSVDDGRARRRLE